MGTKSALSFGRGTEPVGMVSIHVCFIYWASQVVKSQAQQRARDLPGGAADVVTVINAGDTVEGPHFVEPPGTNDVPCDR